ncbi:MAG: hypothetical protein PHG05_00130 [Candidatus Nanoarchaeia archaeon]|nr:hypothetical protein [Candidatus Nanoarchaeia archaeon]
MKERFARAKALFEIIIIIVAIFSISLLNFKDVKAEEYGCCFLKSEGSCFDNTSKQECTEKGGEFFSSPDCSAYSKCQEGCCKIGTECSYVNKFKCEQTANDYNNLDFTFQEGTGESSCSLSCQEGIYGCCLDEGCKYTTSNSCSGEFYENKLCSDVGFCGCTKNSYNQCYEGDVYSFDSCGNKESLVKKCDYQKGLKCREEKNKVDCYSINCESTYKDENTKGTGVFRKNGESWCIYDSATGPGLDSVGSRHYRHICINGEEIEEPCEDYRNEFCVYADVTVNGETFREASCKINNYEKCMTECNSAYELIPMTYDDDDLYKGEVIDYANAMENDLKCCLSKNNDCYWLPLNTTKTEDMEKEQLKLNEVNGRCLPLVVPGNLGENSKICENGVNSALTVWSQDSVIDTNDCSSGCEAYSNKWLQLSNYLCNAAGDCGAKYNWKNEFNNDGFSRKWDSVIEDPEDDFGDFLDQYPELKNMPLTKITEALLLINKEKLAELNSGLYAGKINYEDINKNQGLDYNKINTGIFTGGFFDVSADTLGVLGTAGIAAAEVATLFTGADTTFGNILFGNIIQAGGTASESGGGWLGTLFSSGTIGTIVTVALVVFAVFTILNIFATTKESRVVSTECNMWNIPNNGDNCEDCGKVDNEYGKFKECSKYKCESLGTLCEFIEENAGTDRPACVKVESRDVSSPIISAWPENLTKGFKLNEETKGYKINPDVPAYTRLSLGIKTDKVAQCKFSENVDDNYNEMVSYFGEGYYETKHSLNILTEPNKKYNLYVRCKGKTSNANEASYLIRFNTKEGPDLTAPIIETSDPLDGSYIQADLTKILINIYTNEPTKCKYSSENEDYDGMKEETNCISRENKFICSFNVNLKFEDKLVNYYFKCSDNAENVNEDAYPLTLKQSDTLVIEDYSPKSGTLYSNSFTLNVATSGGAENGKAICSYNGIEFKETDNIIHSQEFEDLALGNYNYNIECIDVAGNKASQIINLNIIKDVYYPIITQLYRQDNTVHVVLDEDADCEYSRSDFGFGKGTETEKVVGEHLFIVEGGRYYFICNDSEGNINPAYSINV